MAGEPRVEIGVKGRPLSIDWVLACFRVRDDAVVVAILVNQGPVTNLERRRQGIDHRSADPPRAIGLGFIEVAGARIVWLDEPFAAVTGEDLVKVEGGDKPPLQLFEPRVNRNDLWLRAVGR